MKNAAGDKKSYLYIPQELEEAGITVEEHSEQVRHPEVITRFTGKVEVPRGFWEFERQWYYWAAAGAECPLPFRYATPLFNLAGQDVRTAGHCGCPSPEEWYGNQHIDGATSYHIDTQAGLNLLVNTLRYWNEEMQGYTTNLRGMLGRSPEQNSKFKYDGDWIYVSSIMEHIHWKKHHIDGMLACDGGETFEIKDRHDSTSQQTKRQ